MYQSKFGSNQSHMSAKPRRVRGGVRLGARELPLALGWVGASWLEAMTTRATPEAVAEGFVYAKGGQTRSLEFQGGKIVALVQGRALKAYRVTIETPMFTEGDWERVIGAMSDQAIFGAKMLAGEMPAAIVGLFASLGLALMPRAEELRPACGVAGDEPWCKHACCVGLLVAEMFDRLPFEVFTLRGMAPGELMERLRERRADSAGIGGMVGGMGGIEELGVSGSGRSRDGSVGAGEGAGCDVEGGVVGGAGGVGGVGVGGGGCPAPINHGGFSIFGVFWWAFGR